MKREFVRRFLASAAVAAWGAASLSGVEIVPDSRKIEPLARAVDEPAIVAAQRRLAGPSRRPDDAVPVFIRLSADDPALPEKIRNLAGEAKPIAPRLFAARIPRDAGRYISNWPEVAYIEAGKRARPLLDASRADVEADVVHAGGAGLPDAYTGQGAFVGVVDTGLSAGHRDFYTGGDPARPRVALWDPGPGAAGVDTDWHGTHVAGIAGGNGFLSGGPGDPASYTGMAPGAGLLVVKSTFLTTEIPGEIDRILAAAGASPVAVNLSLGLMIGPHDGTGGFEQSVDARASGPAGSRRIVAVAAGNERTDREHFRAALDPFGAVTVPLTVSPGGATVDIWADGDDAYDVTASIPGGTASVGSDRPPNGATHFQVVFSTAETATATVRLARTRNAGRGTVDAYIDYPDGSFDPAVAVEEGTITEPANGRNVIAVGSYNTKGSRIGQISWFSSLGPTRDGRSKPDVAAPGAVVSSAKSLDPYAGTSPPPDAPNDSYVMIQGTSMAAPHVAGIAALAWESNPTLTGAQMRARLKKTANLPPGVPLPDDTWGHGKVAALRAVSEAVASITAPATAIPGATVDLSSENSSGAYDPSTYDYTLSRTWSLAGKPAASAAALASNAPSASFTPDVPGDYTVSLDVAQSAPAGVIGGTDTAVIHVNNVPTAAISGPASTDNVTPVTFGAASSRDPDGKTLTYRWILVSRPANSVAALPTASVPDVTLAPDRPGTYEIGLRVDDGLDNSALAVLAFRAGFIPGSGGGGGCSVARPGAADAGAEAGTVFFLLAALAGSFALRRRVRLTAK